ncbi:hypothetical protein QLQ12_20850 [Actinoplanes sp. NEAU-A12]|uniref:Uncharacterized protein n=1 Tax=Actinoplanes sandaracinus TaxID=3045177 RepID=A0ABT6WMV6_9ACTN|nr:hypothetical protein [Actinoplanes sandaracinus]MDI6101066.1 hypothetical protein [Actinoplanes sandaracinus]
MTQLDVEPGRTARPARTVAHVTGLLLMISGVAHLGILLADGGGWDGPVSWRKPATFGLSFGLTLITIAWVTGYLVMTPRWRFRLLGIFTADCVLEVAGITVQAWRGVPSHFNTETPVDRAIAMSLAAGGAVLVAVLGAYAVVALRGRVRGGADMRLAVGAGFGLMLICLVSGVAMVARGSILYRTASPAVAYETAGFLKPAHGIALHAVLVLPLLAALLRRLSRDERARHRMVAVATGLYCAATGAALVWSVI